MKETRGFTLVELMIVVAIIGVLAALAIYGVRRYLAASKTAEAKQNIGAIMTAALHAYDSETSYSENAAEGSESQATTRGGCDSATPVPATVPKGKKYQPRGQDGVDFQSGNALQGWKCLAFSLNQPIYYQYHYSFEQTVVAPNSPTKCSMQCVGLLGAIGDLDGDGNVSRFQAIGFVTKGGEASRSTQIYIESEFE